MNTNIKKRYLFIFICIIYLIYVVGLFLRVGIDSDYSNLVLEATDILDGNVFLADWNLTGISFATTDLLFYIIGVAVFGTSIAAYYLASILMFTALVVSAILLCNTNKKIISLSDLLIIIAVGGLPSIYGINVIRAHTAAAAYVLFAIYFINKSVSNKKINYLNCILATVFLSLGITGDAITLLIGIAPIFLISIFKLLSNNNERIKYYINILICLLSAILGKLLDFIFISIGNTNKNQFLDGRFFANFDDIKNNTQLLVSSLLGIYNADFINKKLISITSAWYLIRTLLLIFSVFLVFYNNFKLFRNKNYDFISSIISIGMIIMSIAIIFTDIMADTFSARYIGYFAIFSSILIVRFLKNSDFNSNKIFNQKMSVKIFTIFISLVLIISSLQPINFKPQEQPQNKLADFLKSKGLTNGYAKFWNASHVTVASKNEVKVRAIIYDGQNHMAQFRWFCKNDWYYPDYANFVVIENSEGSEDLFGITKSNVLTCFGKPSQIINYEDYSIYIYNDNLSDRIIKFNREA